MAVKALGTNAALGNVSNVRRSGASVFSLSDMRAPPSAGVPAVAAGVHRKKRSPNR